MTYVSAIHLPASHVATPNGIFSANGAKPFAASSRTVVHHPVRPCHQTSHFNGDITRETPLKRRKKESQATNEIDSTKARNARSQPAEPLSILHASWESMAVVSSEGSAKLHNWLTRVVANACVSSRFRNLEEEHTVNVSRRPASHVATLSGTFLAQGAKPVMFSKTRPPAISTPSRTVINRLTLRVMSQRQVHCREGTNHSSHWKKSKPNGILTAVASPLMNSAPT